MEVNETRVHSRGASAGRFDGADGPGAALDGPGAGRAASAPLMGRAAEPTIFELSQPGRRAWSRRATGLPEWPVEELVSALHRRSAPVPVAEVSERDLVAHFTRLSQRQYGVDTGAYPLGSCTMKYNPKVCDEVASLVGFTAIHPSAPAGLTQGWLELMVELEAALNEITGMAAVSFQPAAGAAGELTGLLIMRAWHDSRGEDRRRILIPDSAHGTNPASVVLGGYTVNTVVSDQRGCVDVGALRHLLDHDVAGIMLTNPNTLGLFEEDIVEMAAAVHEVGGLLYYDGANLNPILGVVRPGDMGFDIVQLNLHKTFATPHGGGGPGAGPVAVTERLAPYLPGPRPVRRPGSAAGNAGRTAGNGAARGAGPPGGDAAFGWAMPERSIGRVHSWHGNAVVLARAYAYVLANGGDGLRRVAEAAVLNANWLRHRLRGAYDIPYDRPNMHEMVLSAASLRRQTGVGAGDVAKRLLEEGFHAPTVYFPLVVKESLMIEPTETESLQTLEALARSLERIAEEAIADPGAGRAAPRTTPVGRVDEVRAARRLVPTWDARP